MKLVSTTDDDATITISDDDLAFLQSAINETLDALDDSELQTRTGETREHARALIGEIKGIRRAIFDRE
jgi:hypothetical protein